MSITRALGVALLAVAVPSPAAAAPTQKLDVTIRGRALTLACYEPRQGSTPRATIVIGSGDVGWVGLAVMIADDLASQGYRVVGINTRQYLAAFTSGTRHVDLADVRRDFQEISGVLVAKQIVSRPLILAGVSEGAALAILAASDAANHHWIDGVITIGLPPTAELAWRWTDMRAWITKRDPDEPSFAPADVIGAVAPLPLYMIQSTRDEYVAPADYQRFLARSGEPKHLELIDASNHRFTDRQPELRAAFHSGLAWIGATLGSKSRT